MKLLLTMIAFSSVTLFAEPVCPKCEVIREYNKSHPGFDGYYEDYQKQEVKKDKKENAPKEDASK